MIVVALTGGLGAGKSTAAAFLRERGAVTLDLDDIAAHALAPGTSTLARVAEEFGPGVLAADGSLDRAALASAAFASRESVERLDAIVHPAVIREVGPAISDLRLLPDPPRVVVVEVPLLVEAPVYAELADLVVALVAPEEVRVRRAVERGMAEDEARRRIRLQATDAARAELADVVIANDGRLNDLLGSLSALWELRLGGTGF
jgi:dephospho-CoA kinase